MTITILHNPRCSKSRKALEILMKSGKKIIIKNYTASRISPKELKEILKKLNVKPREILRKKEAREAKIDHLDGNALIESICLHPSTMERPIVINGNKAVIGRPPETILKIL